MLPNDFYLQMDGKVRVAVRCRPLIPLEINEGCQTCVDFRPELNQVLMSDSRCFTFDFIFPPSVSQTEVYEACAKNFIQSAFEGVSFISFFCIFTFYCQCCFIQLPLMIKPSHYMYLKRVYL